MKVPINDTEYKIQVFSISQALSDLGSGSCFKDLLSYIGSDPVIYFRLRCENEPVCDNRKEDLLNVGRHSIVSAVKICTCFCH